MYHVRFRNGSSQGTLGPSILEVPNVPWEPQTESFLSPADGAKNKLCASTFRGVNIATIIECGEFF